MNAHILNASGVIINTIVVESLGALPNLVDAAIGGSAGDSIVNGTLVLRPAPVVAPTVPQSIPMLNARLTLIGAGWMAGVKSYLAAIPGIEGEKAREYFETSMTMRRNNPLVRGIPAALGKTEAEVDALFISAAALVV